MLILQALWPGFHTAWTQSGHTINYIAINKLVSTGYK